mmetsp:Transcript_26744/g.71201  ORF Transcript_26744/g.71201 Transcript_26744/m.71201 type:complete len:170 (-) Transcript_26744:19-528(-)
MGLGMATASMSCCMDPQAQRCNIEDTMTPSHGSSLHPDARSGVRELCRESVEELIKQLFNLHDLNSDGVIQEWELVSLNQAIAFLHHGCSVDFDAVGLRFTELFRNKLDPEGQPVSFKKFRTYVKQVLTAIDTNPMGQEMIVEQFIAEAVSARMLCDEDSHTWAASTTV